MSYLVTEFYKSDIPDVIICVCQILTPVAVLAKPDKRRPGKRKKAVFFQKERKRRMTILDKK